MNEIDDVIKKFSKVSNLVREKDGQVIDLSREQTFVKGLFLHQDTDGMSEEKSAEFERENKELFNFLLDFNDQIREIF